MEQTIIKDHKIKDMLIQVMIDNEWSDIYITTWTYPAIKIWGAIIKIDEWIEPFMPKDTQEFAESIITTSQKERLLKERNLDFSFSHMNRRFRWNVSFQQWNYMVILRLLSAKIPSIEHLNLPDVYENVCKKGQWLILVTWPTGSWKSTTLASMINFINENYTKHIITIEDPVEYIHPHKKWIIEHKEIWKDVPDYETALKWAMRQTPDVILFWEMRTKEEIETALTLAETWHLVFSTLHTRSASQTISRIIDAFDAWQQNQIRLQLADTMVWVFSQRLLKTNDWTWVRMVKEILINTPAVANVIRENDTHQLPSLMQMWSKEWMQLLEKDVIKLIKTWFISEEEGLKYANNPKIIKEAL